MKNRLLVASLLSALSCAAALAFSAAAANTREDAQVRFPPGKWSLRHPVVSRLGLAAAPVLITSIKAQASDGGITSVRLKNDSGKAVASVKFAWFLFRDQPPQKILQKGESPSLDIKGLPNGGVKNVAYPIVSFAQVYKPLVKDGKLNGDFILEIAVSEVVYEDGSKWERRLP